MLRKALQELKDCFGLPHRHLLPMALILLAGKIGFVLPRGVAYEMDTVTYLMHPVPHHHPPLYSLLLWALGSLTRNAHLFVMVQLTLFCGLAALSLSSWFRTTRSRYVAALVLALDPVTGYFCLNLMSECLFVALLLPWTATVTHYLRRQAGPRPGRILVFAAFLGAALYATRLAAILFPAFFVVLLLWRTRPLRAALVPALVYLLAFQLFLLPVKLAYLVRFDTFSVTGFTGTNLWNNASPLYPDSSLRSRPTNDFERFLATRDTEEFTTANALITAQIEDPDAAYAQYQRDRRLRRDQLTEFEHELAGTAKRLILENPGGYLIRFVLPNLVKPLHVDEVVPITPRVAKMMQDSFGIPPPEEIRYRSRTWCAYLVLLGVATIVHALRRFRVEAATVPIALCWYYCVALPVVAAITPRYMFAMAPVILVALMLVVLPGRPRAGVVPAPRVGGGATDVRKADPLHRNGIPA